MENLLYKKLFSLCCGRKIAIISIGSDLVGGDCLGPLVGQMLVEANVPTYVYGTLECPVNALTVDEVGRFVRKAHPDHLVLAIDSAVGDRFEEGKISISKGGLLPGSADGKKLHRVGDIAITAVTASVVPSEKEFSLVRLGFVYSLAKSIAKLIIDCISHSLYYTSSEHAAIKIEVNQH
jgi:putative sporulation protein YyaC